MLVLSLVGPNAGTERIDLYGAHGLSAERRAAMDQLWRLDQGTVELSRSDWRLMMVSRCWIASEREWLHWVGFYAPSPVSPDGRQGYYLGLGVFVDGIVAEAATFHTVLTAAFEAYREFANAYARTPKGFPFSDMRADRINLKLADLDALEATLAPHPLRNWEPLQTIGKCMRVSGAAFDTVEQFERQYENSQRLELLEEYGKILITPNAGLLISRDQGSDDPPPSPPSPPPPPPPPPTAKPVVSVSASVTRDGSFPSVTRQWVEDHVLSTVRAEITHRELMFEERLAKHRQARQAERAAMLRSLWLLGALIGVGGATFFGLDAFLYPSPSAPTPAAVLPLPPSDQKPSVIEARGVESEPILGGAAAPASPERPDCRSPQVGRDLVQIRTIGSTVRDPAVKARLDAILALCPPPVLPPKSGDNR